MLAHQPNKEPTHIIFADECHYNIGRYRGIAVVSMGLADMLRLGEELRTIISSSAIREFKWEQLRNARMRFAALKMIDLAIKSARAGTLRIDALTWDIYDNRHQVIGRDDNANLQRMYYHLFKNVLMRRWPRGTVWHLLPDENTAIQWSQLSSFLDNAGSRTDMTHNLLTGGLVVSLRQEFSVYKITPCESHEEPFVQMADLFAGLAVYSRQEYGVYERWHKDNAPRQVSFFQEPQEVNTFSNSEKERCSVMHELSVKCKGARLGVSLQTHRGLRTLDPTSPINFWWYASQSESDKAPLRHQW
jgi:YD repeat-containing protein